MAYAPLYSEILRSQPYYAGREILRSKVKLHRVLLHHSSEKDSGEVENLLCENGC